IPSSSEPKTSHYVRISKTKETVADTQHVEDSVATADTTNSLDASESVEELRNRLEANDATKVTVLNNRGTASNHSQTSLGKSGEDKGYPRPNRESESAL
ncbi:hypothetical protein Tco_1331341, partial [Tanacetum coccineum]